jgi:hypothetical protein
MMAITDYDVARRPAVDLEDDSLDELNTRRSPARSPTLDLDEADAAEEFELPGADLWGEELTVSVVAMLSDEFRCDRWFLVHRRSQLVEGSGLALCRDCG